MHKIKLLFLIFAKFCLRIFYAPMKLLPVKKKVTFISRQSDYPSIDFKLLKNELNCRYPDCKVKMLTKQLNNPIIYLLHIIIQMYHIATSKTVVLDSYCIPISVLNHRKELCVIQIWHSIGSMKHFGYAMIGKEEGHSEEIAKVMNMHKNYTYVLISSYSFINDFIEGFNVPISRIMEIPLPRVDLLSDPQKKKEIRERLEKKDSRLSKKANIIYSPTFRKEISNVDKCKIQELIDSIDFTKYNLIYKPHVLSDLSIDDERVIIADSNDFDIIFAADYMISDYSSIIYEAGLLDIPVYLYAYDWNEYKHKRTFNLDLEKDIPTIFTKDPKKIIEAIETSAFDKENFKKFINKNVTITDKTSCSRILELMNIEISEGDTI